MITPSGTAILGNLEGFAGDGGPAQSARFAFLPSSVTGDAMSFAPNGELYFINGSRIRKLTGSGPAVAPVISTNGIVNSGSYVGGAISQGELIAIFGANFGAAGPVANTPQNNSLPTVLGRTKVLFNGIPGAITALTANQINVFVPPSVLTDVSPVSIVVQVDDVVSAAVTVPLATSAPGLFTADSSGSGQGAILNEDGSVNSERPSRGAWFDSLRVFGTGDGVESPQLGTGNLVISTPFPTPANLVQATVGGQAAEILYAGAAPFLATGIFQINVRIPDGVSAGNVPVAVSIGSGATTRQVTVAVQ